MTRFGIESLHQHNSTLFHNGANVWTVHSTHRNLLSPPFRPTQKEILKIRRTCTNQKFSIIFATSLFSQIVFYIFLVFCLLWFNSSSDSFLILFHDGVLLILAKKKSVSVFCVFFHCSVKWFIGFCWKNCSNFNYN